MGFHYSKEDTFLICQSRYMPILAYGSAHFSMSTTMGRLVSSLGYPAVCFYIDKPSLPLALVASLLQDNPALG